MPVPWSSSSLLDREPADGDAADPFLLRAGSRAAGAARRSAQLEDERAQLLARHAALDGDLLDLALAHVAREPDQRGADFGSRSAFTTTSSPMKPMTMRVGRLVRAAAEPGQRVDAALQQRMAGE